MIVIFDLDGTLANIEHRLHHISGEKQDWEAFNKACTNDEPIRQLVQFNWMVSDDPKIEQIWIVSGRSEEVRAETVAWLERHGIFHQKLLMRPEENFEPDDTLKEKWLLDGTIPKDKIFCVFEDRRRVVDMWRRHGLMCLQVAAGEF